MLERVGLREAPKPEAQPSEPPATTAPVSPLVEAVQAVHPSPEGQEKAPEPTPTPQSAPEASPDTAGLPLLTREQVEALFEDMVRPALQSDGGDITLVVLSFNFELGTGAVVVDDIMALATAAADTVLSMAVLPVNEDDERVVENLMRRTRSTSTSSPL